MQTLYVPKYNLHYRVNPKDPCELQWSRKPFGPLTQWQHAMSFKKPIRALDLDDKTKQGVVVLNDSSTYVGSGVRTWGRKFYPAGTRIYSLYAIGESTEKRPMSKLKIRIHERDLHEALKFKSPAEQDFWNSLKESTYSTTGIPAIDKTFYIITYNRENIYIQLGKTKYENPGWAIDEYGRYGRPDKYKGSNDHLIKTDMVFQFLSATFNSVMQKKFPTLEIPENNWKKCWDRELEGTYQFSPNLKSEFKVRFTESYGYNNPPRNLLHSWTKNSYEIESSALSVSCYVYTRMSEDDEFSKGFYDLNKIGITALANQIRKLLKSSLKPIQFTTGRFYDYGNMFGSEWDAGNRNFDSVLRQTKATVARLNDELKSKYKRYASHISLILGMNYRPRPDNDSFNVTYSVPTEALKYVESELGKTALKLVSTETQEKTIAA